MKGFALGRGIDRCGEGLELGKGGDHKVCHLEGITRPIDPRRRDAGAEPKGEWKLAFILEAEVGP